MIVLKNILSYLFKPSLSVFDIATVVLATFYIDSLPVTIAIIFVLCLFSAVIERSYFKWRSIKNE